MNLHDLTNPASETADTRHAQGAELLELATRIGGHQEAMRPAASDRQMLRSYPGLKSTKTFSVLKRGELALSSIAATLRAYRGVLAQIEAEADAVVSESLLPDLSPAEAIVQAGYSVLRSSGLDRFVLVEGDTSSGKTFGLRALAAELPGTVLICEADESCTSLHAFLGVLLTALGVAEAEQGGRASQRLSKAVSTLGERRVLLCIDEGHHCGPRALNVIKTLINKTRACILLAAMPSLWSKLRGAAAEEVRQLMLNRLHCRVTLTEPTVADAQALLIDRLGLREDGLPARKIVAEVVNRSARAGRMAFLRRVAHQARDLGLVEDGAIEASALLEAASAAEDEIK